MFRSKPRKWEVDVSIDGVNFTSCAKLTSGGSKTIFDLGDGYVLGVTKAPLGILDQYLDTEVALSKKLMSVGLRTQEHEKVIATINDETIPALKMPHFKTLASQGMQVRDRKNRESSCGDSKIFGSLDKLKDVEHWRHILKDISHDIAVYLINNFNFGSDSFNLVIEDTSETANARATTASKLFTDLKQTIHLYFFDFSDKDCLYEEGIYYRLINLDGSASDENIAKCVNGLRTKITDTIFCGLPENEHELIMGSVDYHIAISQKTKKTEFDTAWNELVSTVISEVKEHLNNMPVKERIDQYTTNGMKFQLNCQKEIDEDRIRREECEKSIEANKRKIEELNKELAEFERLKAIDAQFKQAQEGKKDDRVTVHVASNSGCTLQ